MRNFSTTWTVSLVALGMAWGCDDPSYNSDSYQAPTVCPNKVGVRQVDQIEGTHVRGNVVEPCAASDYQIALQSGWQRFASTNREKPEAYFDASQLSPACRVEAYVDYMPNAALSLVTYSQYSDFQGIPNVRVVCPLEQRPYFHDELEKMSGLRSQMIRCEEAQVVHHDEDSDEEEEKEYEEAWEGTPAIFADEVARYRAAEKLCVDPAAVACDPAAKKQLIDLKHVPQLVRFCADSADESKPSELRVSRSDLRFIGIGQANAQTLAPAEPVAPAEGEAGGSLQ